MKRLITAYSPYLKYVIAYILLLVLLAIFTFAVPVFDLPYAIIPAVIILGCLILQPTLKQYSIPIFSFTLAIASGIYGFSTESTGNYPFPNVLYSTVRLFVLDVDAVFSKTGDRFIFYPPSIEVARWAAVLYVISAISQLVMSYFGQSIKQWLMTTKGNHYVIIGLNQHAYKLAENLLFNKRPVLIISDNPFPLERELQGKGAVIVTGDILSTTTYRKAAVHKAKYVLTLHQEDAYNLNVVRAVQHYLENDRTSFKERSITFFVQQNHIRTEQLFRQLENKIRLSKSQVRLQLHPISIFHLIARQLFDQHPIYKQEECQALDINGAPFHMLFIGFGLTGQQIALQAIQRAHFYHSSPLHITVVDRQANMIQQAWKEAYPRLHSMATMQFIEQDVEAEDIGKLIEDQVPEVTHVYISLDSDENDVLQAMRLHHKFKKLPIYLKLQRDEFFANWLHEEAAFQNVYRFGALEEVLTENIVINEKLDEMAKLAHNSYMKENPDRDPQTWDELSHFHKQSNRALMDHYHTKLFLLGYEARNKDDEFDEVPISKEEFEKEIHNQLEVLAEVEHRRWSVFHFTYGWDTYERFSIKDKKHIDHENKLHGCLIDWDELDELNKIMEKDFKQNNRKTILDLYQLTKEMKLALYKRKDGSER